MLCRKIWFLAFGCVAKENNMLTYGCLLEYNLQRNFVSSWLGVLDRLVLLSGSWSCAYFLFCADNKCKGKVLGRGQVFILGGMTSTANMLLIALRSPSCCNGVRQQASSLR